MTMTFRTACLMTALVLVSMLSLTGCETEAGKLIEHYEAINDIVEAHADDCPAMVEEIRTYEAEHGQAIGQLWDKGQDMSGSEAEGERLAELIMSISTRTAPCKASVPGLQ